MWVRLRRTLGLWLLQNDVAAAKTPPMAAPVVMAMQDAGNENVQKAQGSSGPVHLSMTGVGSGNTQVGYAGGQVVSQVSHHSHNHSHTHSHVTVIQASAQAPANESQVRRPSSAEQSATLRRMNRLNTEKRIRVLNFMESKFGTRMVIELKAEQLNLLNRYLEPVMKDTRNLKSARPARAA